MRIFRFFKRLDWKVYTLELFIVVLGISIAYQLNIFYENKVSDKLEITAIQNLKKEIEINIEEFESLVQYRSDITSDSRTLLQLLREDKGISLDSANKYIFKLVRTSTPDLQQEAANFYLNSNYSASNILLKNELLSLKTYLQELMELSLTAKETKLSSFFVYLQDAVDFTEFKIVDLSKINSLRFKNMIWNQAADEQELNRLFDQAFAKLKEVQIYIQEILSKNT